MHKLPDAKSKKQVCVRNLFEVLYRPSLDLPQQVFGKLKSSEKRHKNHSKHVMNHLSVFWGVVRNLKGTENNKAIKKTSLAKTSIIHSQDWT